MQAKEGTLRVPGATLYYKVRGVGPMLLVLQGGDGDADGLDALCHHLVDAFTVVTYDRRGLSRSPLDAPTNTLTLETHSDDAHRLLAALTADPAYVFGGSLGALLGLELVARHPEQVRMLVAHEPPAPELLPDVERARAVQGQEEMEETFRREGPLSAMRKALIASGVDFDDREPDVVVPSPSPRRAANLAFFLTYDAPAVHRYRLPPLALQAVSARVVPAAGLTSREHWPHQCARALADRLGTQFVEFPGGHNGYVLRPRAFAAMLRELFGARAE